jgi:hypothetical protein
VHPYSVDSTEHRNVPFFLAAAAIALTLVGRTLFPSTSEPAFVTYVLSGFTYYGLLYVAFDRWLWKLSLLRRLRIVSVPALHGTWVGELRSSASEYSKTHRVKLRVHQTWTTIRLTLDSERSFSSSEMASIASISSDEFELRWEYLAEATALLKGEGFNHRGVTMLHFEVRDHLIAEMSGNYYTQHGRDTNGSISVKRETYEQKRKRS